MLATHASAALAGARPTAPETGKWDAVIVGGGFYGLSLALELSKHGERVVVLEREDALLQRASYSNQARVHNGYHYPRSILTSLRSRLNYGRFCNDFPSGIYDTFTQVYAIPRRLSKINAHQFLSFCHRIGAEIAPAPKPIAALFNTQLIESVFVVEECAFDAVELGHSASANLGRWGVHRIVGADVERLEADVPGEVTVHVRSSNRQHRLKTRKVFNCTYSGINRLLGASGLPLVPLKHELAEIALVEVPDALRGIGITVMDGPFFSVMPFPARQLHSFTHVRYTPHGTWTEGPGLPAGAPERVLGDLPESSFPYMLRDAVRYVPALSGCRYRESLWEIKTVLPQSEHDDSRPILLHRSPSAGEVWSVLGAKIDSVYDVQASLNDTVDVPPIGQRDD